VEITDGVVEPPLVFVVRAGIVQQAHDGPVKRLAAIVRVHARTSSDCFVNILERR